MSTRCYRSWAVIPRSAGALKTNVSEDDAHLLGYLNVLNDREIRSLLLFASRRLLVIDVIVVVVYGATNQAELALPIDLLVSFEVGRCVALRRRDDAE